MGKELCEDCNSARYIFQGKCRVCWNIFERNEKYASAVLYTAGYAGVNLHDFFACVVALEAVVFDIRNNPFGGKGHEHWSKPNLECHLNEQYRHCQKLGNKNYKGDGIEIVDFFGGFQEIWEEERAIILLCGCKDRFRCHRGYLAGELEKLGFRVSELSDWRKDGLEAERQSDQQGLPT
jgi:hypothetical protein